jgi:probable rRNA maturation factor
MNDDDPDFWDLEDDVSPLPEMPDGVAVEISDAQAHLRIDPDAVATLVRTSLEAEGVTRASISIALVDDATIHALNRRHLDHDWPTDVISFILSEPDEPALSAELVVSVQMAVATAKLAGVAPWEELALYLVHGSLHLCGYDDQDDANRDVMRRREGEILARNGLTNTFPAAVPSGTEYGERERARWTL